MTLSQARWHVISESNFAWEREALDWLREDHGRIVHAGEEFFRVFMPLTQIGRVCPRGWLVM
jgi:hypothetical protein